MAGNWERMLAEVQRRGWRHFCVKMALEIQKRREGGKGKGKEGREGSQCLGAGAQRQGLGQTCYLRNQSQGEC